MKLIAAYIIFLLGVTVVWLAAIPCGVIAIALHEGAAWFRTAHPFALLGQRRTKEYQLCHRDFSIVSNRKTSLH